MSAIPAEPPQSAMRRWADRLAPLVRAFHTYATWLVSISWKRFFVLSILLLIVTGIMSNLPPFTWTISQTEETVPQKKARVVIAPKPPDPPKAPGEAGAKSEPLIKIERPKGSGNSNRSQVSKVTLRRAATATGRMAAWVSRAR